MKSIPVEKREGELQYSRLWMDKVIDALGDGFYVLDFVSTAKRTLSQLRYYRGVILPRLAAEAAAGSYTPEQWHIILADKFLSIELEYKGQIVRGTRSTSNDGDMTAVEFGRYLDQVIEYALYEHGVDIPRPYHYGF